MQDVGHLTKEEKKGKKRGAGDRAWALTTCNTSHTKIINKFNLRQSITVVNKFLMKQYDVQLIQLNHPKFTINKKSL